MKNGSSVCIRVFSTRPLSYQGNLVLGSRLCKCALGRSGLRLRKCEGDGATPIGRWPLRYVLYRSDRVVVPRSRLPVFPIRPDDGWCDDPSSDRYNQPVTLPSEASAETLWRDDALYDIIVVLGHNDRPPVPGRGSAIFLHIAAPGYAATEGCVAVTRRDMLGILERCGPSTEMIVG